MKGGRPLRFLVFALGTWAAIRAAVLLPDVARSPAIIRLFAPQRVTAVPRASSSKPIRSLWMTSGSARSNDRVADRHFDPRRANSMGVPSRGMTPLPTVLPPQDPPKAATRPEPMLPALPAPPAPALIAAGENRFAASAWLLARGGPAGTLSGGQLGASQAGLRITYALGEQRRFALAARIAAPLEGRGREAALGLEWQPTRWPVRLIAEQRFVLDGGRGGPTVGLITGYGPGEIAPGIRFEAYGQAGAIARAGIEAYGDAAARLTHPIVRVGGVAIDGGLGLWGSAQRDAERLDVGPTLGVAVPVGGRSIRVALDWRERIGGAARPGSGPALSIGSDF